MKNPPEPRVLPASQERGVTAEPDIRVVEAAPKMVSLRPEWKTSVDSKGAVTAIAGTVAVLSILGFYLVYTGRFPIIPPVFYLAVIGFLWTVYLIAIIRFGRHLIRPWPILQLTALTALLVSIWLPDGNAIKPRLMDAWMVFVIVRFISQMFVVRRQSREKENSR